MERKKFGVLHNAQKTKELTAQRLHNDCTTAAQFCAIVVRFAVRCRVDRLEAD
jgi:hypothetical protein